jgi:hypothetical protein
MVLMTLPTLTLRTANGQDHETLRRLAALDSQRPLTGSVLLAEAGGVAVAAVAVATGRVTADPFRPTAEVATLLRARAGQLRGGTVLDREYSSLLSADAATTGGHPRAAQAPRGLSLTRTG